ncbi:transposase [Propioniciclava soli]|uniref:Transposase n=1 Tax=Propioniciclava soli TaxID=2775081 RepID=A0ABZ3C873_9ACTN
MLHEQLAQAAKDLQPDLLGTFGNARLSDQADVVCGGPCDELVNPRNGYRHRNLDTRIDALDVAVPTLRRGVAPRHP